MLYHTIFAKCKSLLKFLWHITQHNDNKSFINTGQQGINFDACYTLMGAIAKFQYSAYLKKGKYVFIIIGYLKSSTYVQYVPEKYFINKRYVSYRNSRICPLQ